MMWEVYKMEGVKMGVNYGVNKVRFPAPVPAGSRIRMHLELKELQEIEGGAQAIMLLTFGTRRAGETRVRGRVGFALVRLGRQGARTLALKP